MRCAMCDRLMLTAAVSIPTRGGAVSYGPKCAKRAGLMQRVERRKAAPVQRVDEGQEDWIKTQTEGMTA